jgi:hypothetical protein
MDRAGEKFRSVLTPDRIRSIVSLLPNDWLGAGAFTEQPDEVRNIYSNFLITRMNNADIFENEARNARLALI